MKHGWLYSDLHQAFKERTLVSFWLLTERTLIYTKIVCRIPMNNAGVVVVVAAVVVVVVVVGAAAAVAAAAAVV